MTSSRFVAFLLVLTSSLGGTCWSQATSASPGSSLITGTVNYRVRMALEPGSVINVRLEDVSLADAPSKLVTETLFSAAGKQVPIPFQLSYVASEIQPKHRYAVRARILQNNEPMFTTTQAYPVITHGAPTHVDLMLQEVSHMMPQPSGQAAGAPAPPAKSANLVGTLWKLTELDGAPPVAEMGANEASLELLKDEVSFAAGTGCNRVAGSYERSGDSLKFKPGPMTMMACSDPLMKQERAFVDALLAVTSYRIKGRTLELLGGEKVVARFRAKPHAAPHAATPQ